MRSRGLLASEGQVEWVVAVLVVVVLVAVVLVEVVLAVVAHLLVQLAELSFELSAVASTFQQTVVLSFLASLRQFPTAFASPASVLG